MSKHHELVCSDNQGPTKISLWRNHTVFKLKHINQIKKAGELSKLWPLLFLLSIHFPGHKANNPGIQFVMNRALLQAAINLYFSLG